jgi:hypothetical protein
MMSRRVARRRPESYGWALTLAVVSGAAILLVLDVLEAVP